MVRKRRILPSGFDLVLAAISPALITGMIVALVYFLVLIFYRGSFSTRIMYILTLYTFAAVLVARIAIEQTRSAAFGYMAALGAAAFYVLTTFATLPGSMSAVAPIINAMLLVLIAYLADRVTFDCTFVDERVSSSGEGLLQSLGWVKSTSHIRNDSRTDREQIETVKSAAKLGHNPGVWILYFSVVALPIFGFGQIFIPAYDTSARRFALVCLLAYLFCSLSLLVIVSLLGLRRYMRQRDIEMHDSITVRWIGLGITSIAILLLLGLILPISSQSMFQMEPPIVFESTPDLQSSRLGYGNEGTQDQDVDSSHTAGETNDPSDKASAATASGSSEQGGESGQSDKGTTGKNSPKGGTQPNSADKSNAKDKASQESDSQVQSPTPPSGKSSSDSNDKKSDVEAGENQADAKDQQSQQASKSDAAAGMDGKSRDKQEQQKTNDQNAKQDESENSPATSEFQQKNQPPAAQQPQTSKSKQSNAPKEKNASSQPAAAAPLPPPRSSFQLQWTSILKWLIVVCLTAMVLFYFVSHPDELRKLLQGFQIFLNAIFQGRKAQQKPIVQEAVVTPETVMSRKPFREFCNPFVGASSVAPREAFRMTFEAFEAWAREHSVDRLEYETPSEFVDRVAQQLGHSDQTLSGFANAYNALAYSGGQTSSTQLSPLKQLWKMMQGG